MAEPRSAQPGPLPLRGRVALVTGTSRRAGIGFAVARRLLGLGASVLIHHHHPHDHAQPWGGDDIAAVLDELRTHQASCGDPHARVGQQSALETGPVSKVWITNALRGLTGTLERLRVDRQLEEALAHGPDPLHLAGVFGIDEKTAIRYAAAARELLETPLERDDIG